ncbi:MAG: MliC family protein, partial [Gloeomargarita sp. DG02_3_bins_56]
ACSTQTNSAFREVAFTCTDGQSLSVRFFPEQEKAVLIRNGETVELPQKPSASGFIYSNDSTKIQGKGDDLTVAIGRMTPLQCKAK